MRQKGYIMATLIGWHAVFLKGLNTAGAIIRWRAVILICYIHSFEHIPYPYDRLMPVGAGVDPELLGHSLPGTKKTVSILTVRCAGAAQGAVSYTHLTLPTN